MRPMFARPPTSASVSDLTNVQAGDSAGDHELLDLLGALEEVVDPERAFADVRPCALTRDDVPAPSLPIRLRSPSCRDESRDRHTRRPEISASGPNRADRTASAATGGRLPCARPPGPRTTPAGGRRFVQEWAQERQEGVRRPAPRFLCWSGACAKPWGDAW